MVTLAMAHKDRAAMRAADNMKDRRATFVDGHGQGRLKVPEQELLERGLAGLYLEPRFLPSLLHQCTCKAVSSMTTLRNLHRVS